MNNRAIFGGLILASLVAYVVVSTDHVAPAKKTPLAKPAPAPNPDCPDGKCPPRPRPKPWGEEVAASVGGPTAADGTEILLDLPVEMHQRNTGGSDGNGLCVYASNRHSGLWADNKAFAELFAWMKKHPGGSYPAKFKKTLEQFCSEKGYTVPPYIQVEDDDLEVLKAACKAGFMPGVTYGFSPSGRYGGKKISHMVTLAHADDKWFTILDNNYPGSYEWMSPAEFKRTYCDTSGKGWAVILLLPGPPPIPNYAPTQTIVRKVTPMKWAIPFALALSVPGIADAAPKKPTGETVIDAGSGYEWRGWSDGTEYALLRYGRQVGAWNVIAGTFRALSPDGVWGPREPKPPVKAPAAFGVMRGKFGSVARYELHGVEASKQAAMDAIEGAIPDFSGKMVVSVIGSKAHTDPVMADLKANPGLVAYAGEIVARAYEPTHWHVAAERTGMETDGNPTIYIQSADGRPLERQDGYDDGPARLATNLASAREKIGRLRRPSPDYDPLKDTDASRPLKSGGGPGTWLAMAGLAGAGFYLMRGKKKRG